MTKKKVRHDWSTLTMPCPDDVTRALLLYWDDILAPKEGVWVHPEDKPMHKRYRAAIKVLLEFFE